MPGEKSLRLYGDTDLVFFYFCFVAYMKNERAQTQSHVQSILCLCQGRMNWLKYAIMVSERFKT